MTVVLPGRTPGVLLRDAGAVTAFASVWQVTGLSSVYAPCHTARITVAGSVVPGAPEVDRSGPSSTAFLAVAESWTRTDRQHEQD